MSERVMTETMMCVESGAHDAEYGTGIPCTLCGGYGDGPTNAWRCPCGEVVERHRGDREVSCVCGREFNSSGQELRSDWRRNASTWDDEVSDLDGYEMMYAGDE